MSDYVIPEPEPKEIDEKLSIELRHLADNAVLKGQPSGNEKCENCRFYLEPYKEISYCWHQKLRILVGAEWWCQWWDPIPEDAQEYRPDRRRPGPARSVGRSRVPAGPVRRGVKPDRAPGPRPSARPARRSS
jgi:hypothetical protein